MHRPRWLKPILISSAVLARRFSHRSDSRLAAKLCERLAEARVFLGEAEGRLAVKAPARYAREVAATRLEAAAEADERRHAQTNPAARKGCRPGDERTESEGASSALGPGPTDRALPDRRAARS